MRINHNIPALQALHQLNKTNTKLDTALERLSSGLRINQAADDAAGLAITQKMNTQIRGLDQANRNAMDGVSLIQTAEGALDEVHSMLQRIRELSVQAANGTYDTEDREAMQAEVDQLMQEVDRISDNTEFNKIKLLNGDTDLINYSTDSNVAEVLSTTDAVEAGAYQFTVTAAASATQVDGVAATFAADGTIAASGTLSINGEAITVTAGVDTAASVYSKISEASDTVGVTVTSSTTPFATGSVLTFTQDIYGPVGITITGDSALLGALGLDTLTTTTGQDAVVDEASLAGFPTGTTVTTSREYMTFKGPDNFEMKVVSGGSTGPVTLTVVDAGALTVQIGANQSQTMEIRIQNLSTEAIGISGINLTTEANAEEAITAADEAINLISSVRSKLGAYQNRLEHTMSNLETASENMTSSLSRILDADMAFEMTNYTQANIISQAGTSMLAQANQRPQSLLQLLQQ